MIRHFFLNKVTFFCAMIFIVGCSSDSVTDDMMIEETATEKRRPVFMAYETTEMLIEYVKGTSEMEKNVIRNSYIDTGLLLGWTVCDINGTDDIETWIFNSEMYQNKKPPKVDPGDDNEPVSRASVDSNCEDYIGG